MGRPKLSNLDRITQDLKQTMDRITRTGEKYQIEGYAEATQDSRGQVESVIVSYPRELGIVHCFRAKLQDSRKSNIIIGQKVGVALRLSEKKEGTLYHNLLDFEVTSLPRRLSYSEGKISFPFCLEQEELKHWEAADEVIETIYRDSWQLCLECEVIS
jgi:hypothetical protein